MHATNGLTSHEVLSIHHRVQNPNEPTPTQGGALDLSIALYHLWLHHIATPHAKKYVADVHTRVVHHTLTPQLAFINTIRVDGKTLSAKDPFFVARLDDREETLHALQRRAIALLAAALAKDEAVDMDARHVHHRFPMVHNGRNLGFARFAWDNTEPPKCYTIVRFLYPARPNRS